MPIKSTGAKPELIGFLIRSDVDGYSLTLPYQPDWDVMCGPGIILEATSTKSGLKASIQGNVSKESFETKKWLTNIQTNLLDAFKKKLKIELKKIQIVPFEGTEVLEYWIDESKSFNSWSAKKRDNNIILDVHLSASGLSAKPDSKEFEQRKDSLKFFTSTFTVK